MAKMYFFPKYFAFLWTSLLLALGRGYGNATRSEDDLKSFRAFWLEDMNKIVVTLRSRELTWIQLKELLMQLDRAGYSETNLQTVDKFH